MSLVALQLQVPCLWESKQVVPLSDMNKNNGSGEKKSDGVESLKALAIFAELCLTA